MKIQAIVIIILMNFNLLQSQTIDIPFIITNGIDTLTVLRVGLDTTATNGIDPQLGEVALPPVPPGAPMVAFDLSPYGFPVLTARDYRYAPSFPFTGEREHSLVYSAYWPVIIIYNFPDGVYANIQDPFGGVLYNENLSDSGSFTIPYNFLSTAILTMYYNNVGPNPDPGPIFSLTTTFLNFGPVAIGDTKTLPVSVINYGEENPLVITNMFSSHPAYTFEPNTFPVTITPRDSQTFNITYTAIAGELSGTIGFIHNAPNSPGILGLYSPTQNEPQILSEIVITSDQGNSVKNLKFGLAPTATDGIDEGLGEFELPPFPPPTAFEARFILPENNFSDTLGSYKDYRFAILPFTGQKEFRLAYQPGSGNDITIIWEFPSYITGVLQDIINGTLINVSMSDTGSFTVPGPNIFNRLRMLIDYDIVTTVEISTSFDIPSIYSLEQNYPNPFNPATTIKFLLPEAANVKLTIYNSLGQKVDEIVNTTLEAGYHSYKWDAGSAASGIYFYELRTERFVSTKKMMLLR